MSLDVYLVGPETEKPCLCPHCFNEHTRTERDRLFEYNITHNLGKMAIEAGLYFALWRPEGINARKASQLVELVEQGLTELKSDPDYYMQFNPQNGWGNYENLVQFVETYLSACKAHPESEVRVSR